MTKQKATDKAKPIFEKDKNLKVLHFTNDEQCFPVENRALVHQKEIGGKPAEITVVKREDALGAVAEVKEEAAEIVVAEKKDEVKEEAAEEVDDESKDE